MLLGLASLYLPTVAAGGSTNSTNGTEVHHDSHDEHNSGGLAIFFFALVLVLGVVTHTIAEWISLPIPYTVLMLILGMLIGASNLQGGPGDNWFHEAMDMYATIDPHLLLGIFLPALIFESAFSSSFHIIKRELGQALLLAGPGVAISMILAAVVGVYIFPYNWSWWAALVFGSILSATDPVAVVALLRELGVSKKLATLIEGESLFNDGTAYVMFLVWREFLVGDELAVWEIITLMLRLAIGGIVFGILFSIPALLWLWSIYANPAIETTITFATAYLCFWFAESHETGIHVSGVLAIVALGLMFNRFKYFISIQAEETVHHFWEMVGFIANTLIFFISGVVVVQRMFADNPNIQLGRDFLFLFILYVLIHVIRGFTVLVLGYPLAKMGYGFNWPMGIVLVWGGLRGAVGLALALMLDLDDEVPDAISDQILFHVAGIVVLTLLINGSTTGTVLGWVGLRKIKPSKLRAYLKAVEAIKAESERKAISMRSEKMFQMADWDLVRRYLPQYEHKTRDLALAKVKEIPFHLEDNDIINMFKDTKELPYPPVRAPSSIVSRDDLKCELTHRLLTAMSAHFSEAYEEGQLSRNAISILNEAAETALDTDSLDVLWKTIDRYFEVSPMMTFLTSCWPWLANKLYLFEFQLAVELAVAFLHALHVIEKVDTLFEQFADHEVYEEMVKEVEEYREKAIIRWDQVETDFPNLYNSMQTLFAIRRLLESEKRAINKLHVKGIIDENEKLKLQDALARQMHWVQFHSIESGQRISSSEIISQIEFWDLLSPQLQRRLKHCRRIAVASKHRVHPHRSNKMFYVMRGILKVQDAAGNKVHVLGIGDLYGTWAAMADRSYIASAVSRSDPAVLLEIDRALLTTMKQDTKLRELLWKISAADVLQMKHPQVFNTSWRKIWSMCETAVVKEFKVCCNQEYYMQDMYVSFKQGPAETHVIKLRTLALILKGQAKKVSLDGRRADEVLEIKGGDNASKRKIAIGTVIKAPGLLVLGKTENRAGYELIKGSVVVEFPSVAPAIYTETTEMLSMPTHRPSLMRISTVPEKKDNVTGKRIHRSNSGDSLASFQRASFRTKNVTNSPPMESSSRWTPNQPQERSVELHGLGNSRSDVTSHASRRPPRGRIAPLNEEVDSDLIDYDVKHGRV